MATPESITPTELRLLLAAAVRICQVVQEHARQHPPGVHVDQLQALLTQQGLPLLGFQLRDVCQALEEEDHLQRDRTPPVLRLRTSRPQAYQGGPKLSQAIDRTALTQQLRTLRRERTQPCALAPRVSHGQVASVFDLGRALHAENGTDNPAP
jgi:hypothetical protein